MRRIFNFIAILSTVVLITGCRLAVIVPEGGEVRSTASGTCVAGNICIVEVTDTNFSETFTAVPDEGWYFEKWQKGDRLLCVGPYKPKGYYSYEPSCLLSFEKFGDFRDSRELQEAIESSEMFYLMPIFRKGVRFVAVDGREWLQPFDFRGYSYAEIGEVCSIDSGLCTGTLPESSIDLTGYYWASRSDIEKLFITYGAEPTLTGPLPVGGEVPAQICSDFLSPAYGFLRGSPATAHKHKNAHVLCSDSGNFVQISDFRIGSNTRPYLGAWFWRTAD